MILVTCCSARGQLSTAASTSSAVHSLKRYITVVERRRPPRHLHRRGVGVALRVRGDREERRAAAAVGAVAVGAQQRLGAVVAPPSGRWRRGPRPARRRAPRSPRPRPSGGSGSSTQYSGQDDGDDRGEQQRPAQHALEVAALELLVVEERREVLGRLLLRLAPDAEHLVADDPDDHRDRDDVDDDEDRAEGQGQDHVRLFESSWSNGRFGVVRRVSHARRSLGALAGGVGADRRADDDGAGVDR